MMSKKHRLFSTTAMSVLLACSFACSQETPPAKPGKDTKPETKNLEKPTAKNDQKQELQKEEITKVSEAFGHFIGRNLRNPGLQFDLDSIIKGMKAGYNGEPAPLSDQEYEELMARLQEKAYNQISDDNLKAADEFLAKNAKEKDVIELVPGQLQYVIVQEGKGDTVQDHDSPSVNYTGKFLDGSKFGSSEDNGGPITVPLDQTIPGFSKGIAGMKEGEKRRLYVHPSLGYGTTGHLPPNSLLIFEVEVLKANADDAQDNNDDQLSDAAGDAQNKPKATTGLNNSNSNSNDDDDSDDDDSDDEDDDEDDEDDSPSTPNPTTPNTAVKPAAPKKV